MRKNVVLYTMLLLEFAHAFDNPLGSLIKLSDDPYSDPADEIPQIDKFPQLDNQFEGLLRDNEGGDTPERKQLKNEESNTKVRLSEMELAQKRRNRLFPDFEALHDVNMKLPEHEYTVHRPSPTPPLEFKNETKRGYLMEGTFALRGEPELMTWKPPLNWTTCPEFGVDSKDYNPDDIADINWVPFFTWTPDLYTDMAAQVHSIMHASDQKIRYYYKKFADILDRKVNWLEKKLLLTTSSFEAILLPVDNRGLYDYISDGDVTEDLKKQLNISLSVPALHLKIVDPYLALMYCGFHLAHLMAREGYGPKTKKLKKAMAAKLNFIGTGKPVKGDMKPLVRVKPPKEERETQSMAPKRNTRRRKKQHESLRALF